MNQSISCSGVSRLFVLIILLGLLVSLLGASVPVRAQADDPSPPAEPVKLIFVHHSTGGNWLADPNDDQPAGGLARALMENNYFVSATNYGWGPDGIGDRTDIISWPEWFTGPNSDVYLEALYDESDKNEGDFGSWTRLASDPGGENEIIMFKSCFPNSDLYGSSNDPPVAEINDQYTVGNAKAVYNELLIYFSARQDKLFVVIAAPPLMQAETAPERADNARAFNNWLVNEWLANYAYNNVAVFDYYNVLTGSDNHHRWQAGAVQHGINEANNFSAYPSGDSHPSSAGHYKATEEFVPLLNVYYNRWQSGETAPPPQPTPEPPPETEPTEPPVVEPMPVEEPPVRPAGVIDDFESDEGQWWPDVGGEDSDVACEFDSGMGHAGEASMRFNYDVAPEMWVGCGLYYDSPQDWSAGHGISLWLRADKSDQWVTLALFSGDADAPTAFEADLEAPEGWTQIVLTWADLPKADWAGDEGLPALDPARITGLGLSVGADESRWQGAMWVDDINLLTGDAPPQPVLIEEPVKPIEETQPIEEPGAESSSLPEPPAQEEDTDGGDDSGGGGICPSAAMVLPLAFVGVFLARQRKR